MARKVIGYILGIAGLASLALSFQQVKDIVKIPIPAVLTDNYLMIIGIVLILLGAFLAFGKKLKRQSPEVPIYNGNQVVGYRRV